MRHRCKMTVLDKKLYPELQAQYCADPDSGPCPSYRVGDEALEQAAEGCGYTVRKID